jgi:hypothetical protein
MKTGPKSLEAFASLRLFGDRLEPGRISELLGTEPTLAYRKGEIYKISRGREVHGRTGLWLVSSEGKVDSKDLNDHFDYLLTIIFSGSDRLGRLHAVMDELDIEADVTCFWWGAAGAKPPVIRDDIRSRFARLPAQIEIDFDTD